MDSILDDLRQLIEDLGSYIDLSNESVLGVIYNDLDSICTSLGLEFDELKTQSEYDKETIDRLRELLSM